LDVPEKGRVLDLASPKLLFLWLAAKSQLDLTATDIMDGFIPQARYLLGRLGLAEEIGGRLRLETQDARALAYADGTFDAAYSISVVEHIPDDGDSRALREIARVLRPGGRLSLTVPFATRYAEEWVGRDVFERRRRSAERLFFQRRYDTAALEKRIIAPSGLREVERAYFGEPALRFDRYWNRLPMALRLPVAWAQPFFERAFLR
jgi:SAM-dependent methyltransferase